MTRHIITVFVFVIFILVLCSNTTANSLSDTYFQAFVNPHGFDSCLNDEVVLNQDYYNNFETCSSLAFPYLLEMEIQLRQQYSVCPNNAICTQIAKDIQTVINLRIKLRKLVAFINTTINNSQARFLNSPIGQDAISIYNFHQQIGIDLRQNPEFVREISILSLIPCQ